MTSLEIKVADTQKEKQDAFAIRHTVFVEEQGIKEELDRDGLDEEATHIVSYLSGKPIGCARVRIIDRKAKWERIATLKEYRGKGYGKEMMQFLLSYSKSLKVPEVYFDAQSHAKEFYEKLGFTSEGDEFEEVGVPHVLMRRRFSYG